MSVFKPANSTKSRTFPRAVIVGKYLTKPIFIGTFLTKPLRLCETFCANYLCDFMTKKEPAQTLFEKRNIKDMLNSRIPSMLVFQQFASLDDEFFDAVM